MMYESLLKKKKLIFMAVLLFTSSWSSANNIEINTLIKAAKQGEIEAQANLGSAYLFGDYDQETNYKKAAYWAERAAQQGDASSQYNLAIMYFRGMGVKQNLEKAFHYYQQAAEQGHTDAQIQLALRYLYAEGTPQNVELAHQWYIKVKQSDTADLTQFIQEFEESYERIRTK